MSTSQYKILLSDPVLVALEEQREALGFLSANALCVVYVQAFADVPPEQVWEALAIVQKYKRRPKKDGRALK